MCTNCSLQSLSLVRIVHDLLLPTSPDSCTSDLSSSSRSRQGGTTAAAGCMACCCLLLLAADCMACCCLLLLAADCMACCCMLLWMCLVLRLVLWRIMRLALLLRG
jgi:hypothetical protein